MAEYAAAGTALGLVSAIISIIDASKKVYDTYKNEKGLPEEFNEVGKRLPLISKFLEDGKDYVAIHADSLMGTFQSCERKAVQLHELFEKVCPGEGASRMDRYLKAFRAIGKGGRVEKLFREIIVDVKLLEATRCFDFPAEKEEKWKKELTKILEELSTVESSLGPDDSTGEVSIVHSGTGDIFANNNTGKQVNNTGANSNHKITGGTVSYGPNFKGAFKIFVESAVFLQNPRTDTEKDCLIALFVTNPWDDREILKNTKGSRADGTCEWIKTNTVYELWLRSHSRLLWLSGGPGKGKTVLSIFLAEELEKINDVSFLQYFCDNKDEKRKTAVNIIRSLILQLLQLQPQLIHHILPAFEIQREPLFSSSSFQTLWNIFERIVTDPVFNTIYCILDGLDECDETSLETLLRNLKALFLTKLSETHACCLKLIIVSRDLPRFIPDTSFLRIELDVNPDIDRVIIAKVNELAIANQYPDELRAHVKEVFRERAQGTLLWVGLVANVLRGCKFPEVQQALDCLPPGLEEVYARLLLQIPTKRQPIAINILSWVILAVRPLTLLELSAAINPPPSIGSSCEEVMRETVSYCGYFLTVQEDIVGIFHLSAKDYLLRTIFDSDPTLESFRIKKEQGNIELTQKCLECINEYALASYKADLEKKATLSPSKYPPLLLYAVLHWPEHAKSLAGSESFFDLSLPFYEKKSLVRQAWLGIYQKEKQEGHMPVYSKLLHLTSYFGIVPLVKNILFKRKSWINNVDKKDGSGLAAMHYAAEQGHEAVVRLLLENGADIKAKNIYSEMALHCAARQGNTTAVRLLLEKGAGIEMKNRDGATALHYAASSGSKELVGLLLEKGADARAKNHSRQTALHYAAYGGFEAVVELLLENGADIDAKAKSGDTALHYTFGPMLDEQLLMGMTKMNIRIRRKANKAVVPLLLARGAETSAKNRYGRTVLHYAVYYANTDVSQLLLENKADINTKTNWGDTVLHLAVEGQADAELVQLLLEYGADSNAKNDSGYTALHLLAQIWFNSGSDVEKFHMLVENGANINAKTNHGRTTLHCAARVPTSSIARLLLANGADIKMKDDFERTALHYATGPFGYHEELIGLLLEEGVDVKAKDRYGWTAMDFLLAANSGNVAPIGYRILGSVGENIRDWHEDPSKTRAIRAHWRKSHWRKHYLCKG